MTKKEKKFHCIEFSNSQLCELINKISMKEDKLNNEINLTKLDIVEMINDLFISNSVELRTLKNEITEERKEAKINRIRSEKYNERKN